MTQRRTLLSICITTALIVILGEGCAKDSMDNSYRPTSAHGPCTPEARAASMRKALRETSEGQEIHRQLVEHTIRQQQNLLDARKCREMVTEDDKTIIDLDTRAREEKEIKRFASHNCRLRNDHFLTHGVRPSLFYKWDLKRKESLFREGEINEEEIQRARTKVQLKEEEYWLRQKFTNILISANNYG